MRMLGTEARGIRLPIISHGDDLANIVVDSVLTAASEGGFRLRERDVIGITEAVVAKAEGNYATSDDIAAEAKRLFGDREVGLVFPILSQNRFLNILKGLSKGAKAIHVLLSYPDDEVGNPVISEETYMDILDKQGIFAAESKTLAGLMDEKRFRDVAGEYLHPFTGKDYARLYGEAGDNIRVWFSRDPRDILKLTPHVLIGEIHRAPRTAARLKRAGAETVYLLTDILSAPVKRADGSLSGYNEQYGVLGSNIASSDTVKLFPRGGAELTMRVKEMILQATGINLEVMVYGDGAFKDPACGIWELADPVVSPAYTPGLSGTPNEIKLKYVADNNFSALRGEEKRAAVTDFIRAKSAHQTAFVEGTTPRRYTDLLGSLCDLISGSGDKGTPVVLIQGYFDNYASL